MRCRGPLPWPAAGSTGRPGQAAVIIDKAVRYKTFFTVWTSFPLFPGNADCPSNSTPRRCVCERGGK